MLDQIVFLDIRNWSFLSILIWAVRSDGLSADGLSSMHVLANTKLFFLKKKQGIISSVLCVKEEDFQK